MAERHDAKKSSKRKESDRKQRDRVTKNIELDSMQGDQVTKLKDSGCKEIRLAKRKRIRLDAARSNSSTKRIRLRLLNELKELKKSNIHNVLKTDPKTDVSGRVCG